MDKPVLYTVGHSNQSQEEFLELLSANDINCIIDVRSMPYSKYTPQFNTETLKSFLNANGILYAHFGNEFGARRSDCLTDIELPKKSGVEIKPQVNFEIGVTTPAFLHGVERLERALSQGRRISLMCSESDPLGCHRFSFLSRFFFEKGWTVNHIIRDSQTAEPALASHARLEHEMIMDYVNRGKLKAVGGQILSLFSDFGDGWKIRAQMPPAPIFC